MAKGYLSNRQKNLKIGIVSYTENSTVLEVSGKVGIGTTNAQSSLHVVGNANITGIATIEKLDATQLSPNGVSFGQLSYVPVADGNGSWDWQPVAEAGAAVVNGIGIAKTGEFIGYAATILNFTGNVIQDITISSGIANITATIQPNSVALGDDTTGNYVATIADVGSNDVVVNNSGSETAAVTLGLSTTGVSAGSYGSSSAIPTFTVDSRGRLTVAGTAVIGTATSTTNIPNLTGAITSDNTTTSLGSFTSAQLATALTDETGSGSAVFATSPSLVAPSLGAASATSINVSGVTTSTGGFVGALTGNVTGNVNSTGVSTFTNGPVFIGSATSTGTASQPLQVTGGAYVSGSLGIGTTNPQRSIHVVGVGSTSGVRVGNVDFFAFSSGNDASGSPTFRNSVLNANTVLRVIPNGSGVSQFEFFGNDYYSNTSSWDNVRIVSSSTEFRIDSSYATGGVAKPIRIETNVSNNGATFNNPYQLYLATNGNVGIATSSVTSKLTVSGDGLFTGIVTASSFSGNASSATYATTAGVSTYASTAGVATALQNARTISLTGDVIGSVSFDGTTNVSIAATIQPDSVGLGTDTTGNYVQSISGTSNQITVTGGTGEGSTPTLSIPNQFTAPQDIEVTRDLQVNRNLNVNGNITIGGTAATLFTTELKISDPDIVLGFRTDALGNDASTDNTANHGGIAIASTEGTPLVNLFIAGIETNPATYKKIMWFKAGEFAGLGTDAWLSNYAVGIGSTQFPSGTRLAAGAVQFTERDLTVVRDINASGIVTASTFSGQINAGISTLGIATATNLTAQQLNVSGIATVNGNLFVNGNTLVADATNNRVGIGTTNPTKSLHVYTTDGDIRLGDITEGTSTTDAGVIFTGLGSNTSAMFTEVDGTILSYGINCEQITGIETARAGGIFRLDTRTSGSYGDASCFVVKGRPIGSTTEYNAIVVGLNDGNTYLSPVRGNVLVGSATSTGTASQTLQVTGGAYFSSNVGIGTTNPSAILDIRGNPWFSPNTTGVKATALRLGRFSDSATAAYDILTNDAVGDDIEIQSNRFAGNLKFSRSSPSGIQTVFTLASNYISGTSVSIADTTGTVTKIQLNEAGNTYFNNSGAVLVGSATSTGTASQPLQVTGGAYVSGNLGVGVTNSGVKLDVYSPTSGGTAIRATSSLSFSSTLYPAVIAGLSTNAASSYASQFAAAGVGATSGELGVYSFYPTFANFPADRGPRRAVDLVGGFATGVWGTEYFAINVGRNGVSNDSAVLTNERFRITGTGNVGVGTTNPTTNLHVVGDARITGVITASSFIGNASSATYATTAGVSTSVIGGIGSITSLSVSGISTLQSTTLIGSGTSTGTASQALQVTGGAYVSGSIGIGITSPTDKLHVLGVARVGLASTAILLGNDNGRNIDIGVGSTNLDCYIDFYGTPTYTDYGGRLIRYAGDNSNFDLINRGTGALRIISQDAGTIDFATNNTVRARIDSNGTVLVGTATSTGTASQRLQVTGGAYVSDALGIGTTNPTSTLTVQGNALITGVITSTSFVKSGGTSSQFLKADGSVDSSTYVSTVNDLVGLSTLGFFGDNQNITSNVTLPANTLLYTVHKNINVATGATLTVGSGATIVTNRLNNLDDVTATSFAGDGSRLTGIPVGDLYELDQISPAGGENTYTPTFNYDTVSVTDPFRLLISIDGILQSAYVHNTEYVFNNSLLTSRTGYTIDYDGRIKFTESLSEGSEVMIKTTAGTTKSTPRRYPFNALDILF